MRFYVYPYTCPCPRYFCLTRGCCSQSLVAERYARWALGCRLEFVGTGGAHTSAEVFNFMKTLTPGSTFEPVNSYGTTEVPGTTPCVCDTAPPTCAERASDVWGVCTVAGICNNGVISDDIEVKLVDVPSMNYLSTYVGLNAPRTAHVVDTTVTRPSDKPWPRGEIWARSKTFMTPGYWNQPAATADAFEVRHHCKALCSLVTVGTGVDKSRVARGRMGGSRLVTLVKSTGRELCVSLIERKTWRSCTTADAACGSHLVPSNR